MYSRLHRPPAWGVPLTVCRHKWESAADRRNRSCHSELLRAVANRPHTLLQAASIAVLPGGVLRAGSAARPYANAATIELLNPQGPASNTSAEVGSSPRQKPPFAPLSRQLEVKQLSRCLFAGGLGLGLAANPCVHIAMHDECIRACGPMGDLMHGRVRVHMSEPLWWSMQTCPRHIQ